MKRIGKWVLPRWAALALLAAHGTASAEELCKLLPDRRAGLSHYAVSSVLKLRTNTLIIEHVMVVHRTASCEQALLMTRRQIDLKFPDYVYDPTLTIVMEVAPVVEAASAPLVPERVRPGHRVEERKKVEI